MAYNVCTVMQTLFIARKRFTTYVVVIVLLLQNAVMAGEWDTLSPDGGALLKDLSEKLHNAPPALGGPPTTANFRALNVPKDSNAYSEKSMIGGAELTNDDIERFKAFAGTAKFDTSGMSKTPLEIHGQKFKVKKFILSGASVYVSEEVMPEKTGGIERFRYCFEKALIKATQTSGNRLSRDLFILHLDQSKCFFEDHIGNGFIGINKRLFEIADPKTFGVWLTAGLFHELCHEITQLGEELEGRLSELGMDYVRCLCTDFQIKFNNTVLFPRDSHNQIVFDPLQITLEYGRFILNMADKARADSINIPNPVEGGNQLEAMVAMQKHISGQVSTLFVSFCDSDKGKSLYKTAIAFYKKSISMYFNGEEQKILMAKYRIGEEVAEIYRRMGDFGNAIALYYILANSYTAQPLKRYDKAMEMYNAILLIDPLQEEAFRKREQIRDLLADYFRGVKGLKGLALILGGTQDEINLMAEESVRRFPAPLSLPHGGTLCRGIPIVKKAEPPDSDFEFQQFNELFRGDSPPFEKYYIFIKMSEYFKNKAGAETDFFKKIYYTKLAEIYERASGKIIQQNYKSEGVNASMVPSADKLSSLASYIHGAGNTSYAGVTIVFKKSVERDAKPPSIGTNGIWIIPRIIRPDEIHAFVVRRENLAKLFEFLRYNLRYISIPVYDEKLRPVWPGLPNSEKRISDAMRMNSAGYERITVSVKNQQADALGKFARRSIVYEVFYDLFKRIKNDTPVNAYDNKWWSQMLNKRINDRQNPITNRPQGTLSEQYDILDEYIASASRDSQKTSGTGRFNRTISFDDFVDYIFSKRTIAEIKDLEIPERRLFREFGNVFAALGITDIDNLRSLFARIKGNVGSGVITPQNGSSFSTPSAKKNLYIWYDYLISVSTKRRDPSILDFVEFITGRKALLSVTRMETTEGEEGAECRKEFAALSHISSILGNLMGLPLPLTLAAKSSDGKTLLRSENINMDASLRQSEEFRILEILFSYETVPMGTSGINVLSLLELLRGRDMDELLGFTVMDRNTDRLWVLRTGTNLMRLNYAERVQYAASVLRLKWLFDNGFVWEIINNAKERGALSDEQAKFLFYILRGRMNCIVEYFVPKQVRNILNGLSLNPGFGISAFEIFFQKEIKPEIISEQADSVTRSV